MDSYSAPPPPVYPYGQWGTYPPPPPPPPRALPKEAYTPWSTRLAAFVIDWIPFWIVYFVPYFGFMENPTDAWTVTFLIALVLCTVYFLWNFCYRQGKTGQSLGKSAMNFVTISETTWQPIGFWRSLLRQIAHYVDQLICYVGYFFPLWDSQRKTIADMIMHTVSVPVGTPMPPPRPGYEAIAEPMK